ncbi:hypothetical protein [Gimesia sp.]|uniref:hypothetical protein n=1 Tax=Gimesia sp. TaxID=2024833 RepID=UPI003A94C0C5
MEHQDQEELQEASGLDIHASENNKKQTMLLSGVVVFLFAFIYLLPTITTLGVVDMYDEGLQLSGAQRVLAGDMPYHDFYCIYGPGTFYWLAALFKVFGDQLIVSRLNDAVICALSGTMIFTICRIFGLAKRWSLIAPLVYLAALDGSPLKMISPALMLILAAGLRLSADVSQNRRPYLPGILLGLSAVFRHDFGVYGFVASVLVIACPRENSQGIQERFRSFVSLLTGFIFVAGAIYGALLTVGFHSVFENLVIYPAMALTSRVLPYPVDLVVTHTRGIVSLLFSNNILMGCAYALFMISQLLVFIAPILTLFLVAPLAKRKQRGELFRNNQQKTLFLFLIALSILFIPYGFNRCDFWHLFPVFVVSLPIWVILIHFYISCFRKAASLLRPIMYLFISFFILDLTGTFVINVVNYQKGLPVKIDRAQGMIFNPENEINGLVALVHELENDKQQSPIFVGSPRHDKVFINAIMIYFLSGRRSGTFYHHLDPGVTTTRSVQQKIIKDLESNQVDTVVLWNRKFVEEPNQSKESSGVTRLDEFIDRNFKHSKKIGEFTLKRQ